MKKLSQLLLHGVVPGNYISVVYGGTANQFTAEGYVKVLGELLVLSREDWGQECRIPEDCLVSVTLVTRPEGNLAQLPVQGQSLPVTPQERLHSAPQEEQPVLEQSDAPAAKAVESDAKPQAAPAPAKAPAPVAPAKPAAPVLPQPGRELVPLAARTPWAPDLDEELNQLRAALKKVGNKNVRSGLNAILDSMRDAQRTGSVAEKYQGLRAKTLTLWEHCAQSEDYYSFYWTLGLLALWAEDYPRAMEPLVRSRHYTLAAYAAEKAEREDYRGLFVICALLAKEPAAQVNQDVADIFLKRQDVDLLPELMERLGEDEETAERLLSCAWYICAHSGCKVDSGWEDLDTADAMEFLFAALPVSWKQESKLQKKWEVYDQYTYPVAPPSKEKTDENGWITGRILNFYPTRRFGFISAEGLEQNVYFYIKQVDTEKPEDLFLRNLLSQGKAVGLEVGFSMGESRTRKGERSANDIYLTEKGYDEAVRRITADQHPEEKVGCITEYPNEAGFGRLYLGGKPCNYLMDSIVDPYLRAYLSLRTLDHSFQDQNVFFLTEYRGSKLTAQKIRWKDPRDVDLELARSQVSEDSAALWQEYLAAMEEAKNAPVELPDKADPYPDYPFELLDDWTEQPNAKTTKSERPLTWKISNGAKEHTAFQTQQIPPVRRPQSSAREQAASHAAPADFAPAAARQLAEQGKKAILANDPATGEKLLLQSLDEGMPAEPVVGDLVSLYLRTPERIPEGIALLDRYAASMEPEKVLNLRISLYDKQHNYDALLPLYEEAIRTASGAARKSHNLFRMLGTLLDMGRNEQALEVCDRWNALLSESADSPEEEKLFNALPSVERRHALCLSRLGRDAEARAVAEQLLKLNPEDECALQILRAQETPAEAPVQAEPAVEAPVQSEPAAEASDAPADAAPADATAPDGAPAAEAPAAVQPDEAPAAPAPAEDVTAPDAESAEAPAE